MFLTMGTWWRFDDIAATAVLCAAPRDGVSMEELENYAARLEAEGAVCALENIPLTPLSSTDVRGKLRRHESVEGLIPPAVAAYIARRGLYTAAEAAPLDRDEQFIEIIRGRLTPARFRHSLAVAEEAERLARKYGADPAKARTAGILHDILKDAGEDAQLQIFQDFAILLDNVERQAPKLWHAHAGAVFIEKVLGVEDGDIVTAVRYHTTGRAGMSLLEKVLFIADFTSADRDYKDVDVMRRLADEDLSAAMRYALSYTIRDLVKKQAAIHPDTLAAYNERDHDGAVNRAPWRVQTSGFPKSREKGAFHG